VCHRLLGARGSRRVETFFRPEQPLFAPLGGSLAALLILSGYGLLWLELGDAESHIVVRKTSLDYGRPVHDPLRAICTRPPEDVLDTFREIFARRRKARIELHATVEQDGEAAVEFHGLFVALRVAS
jgi:thioesterase domain-containing protein